MSEERKIMIVQDGCGYCEEAKGLLKEEIDNGKILVLDSKSPMAKDFIQKYDIKATPTFLSGVANEFQKCFLTKDATTIVCEDGTEKKVKE